MKRCVIYLDDKHKLNKSQYKNLPVRKDTTMRSIHPAGLSLLYHIKNYTCIIEHAHVQ